MPVQGIVTIRILIFAEKFKKIEILGFGFVRY
jgi:uncharacterized membrane protein